MHGDRAAHHVDDVLGDRHAEARALNAADRAAALARERLEDRLPERFAHADAAVLDAELEHGALRRRRRLFDDAEADHAARGRKLDRVRKDVQQDLVEPEPVGHDVLVHDVLRVDEQLQLLGRDVGLNDRPQVMNDVGQVRVALVDRHLAALDAAHVEHVVDQRQQMLARYGDLRKVVLHLLPVVDVRRRKRGKPDDRVHRRADIVRHVVQKRRFGAVGVLGGVERDRQRFLAFLEFAVALLEGEPRRLLLARIAPRAPRIAQQQEDDDRRHRKDYRAEQRDMVAQHVEERVRIQPVGVAVGQVLRIVGTDHVDAAVQKLQQPLVADLDAEAPVVVAARLVQRQAAVSAVL